MVQIGIEIGIMTMATLNELIRRRKAGTATPAEIELLRQRDRDCKARTRERRKAELGADYRAAEKTRTKARHQECMATDPAYRERQRELNRARDRRKAELRAATGRPPRKRGRTEEGVAAEKTRRRARDKVKRLLSRHGVKLSQISAADRAYIRELFAERDRRAENTGIAYEIDHDTPLTEDKTFNVRNLRIVTASFNRIKSTMPREVAVRFLGEIGHIAAQLDVLYKAAGLTRPPPLR